MLANVTHQKTETKMDQQQCAVAPSLPRTTPSQENDNNARQPVRSVTIDDIEERLIAVPVNNGPHIRAGVGPIPSIAEDTGLIIEPWQDLLERKDLLGIGTDSIKLHHVSQSAAQIQRQSGKGSGVHSETLKTYLQKPNISATSSRLRTTNVVVEILDVRSGIIPMDRHEINLAANALVEEFFQPRQTSSAIANSWRT